MQKAYARSSYIPVVCYVAEVDRNPHGELVIQYKSHRITYYPTETSAPNVDKNDTWSSFSQENVLLRWLYW